MTKLSSALVITVLVAGLFCGLACTAQAQATRTYVSGAGSNSNPCTSRSAPCLTLQKAHDQTTAGGEVTVLDTADYGTLHITKSISIAAGGENARILSTSNFSSAILVDPAVGVVNLRGLIIDGGGTGNLGIFSQAITLNIERCVIRGFKGGNSLGISFEPAQSSQINIVDTIISDNSVGVQVRPLNAANLSLNVTLTRVQLTGNGIGLNVITGSSTGGTTKISVNDSVIAGSLGGAGISVDGSQANSPLFAVSVKNSLIVSNATGVLANGSQAVVLLDGTTVQSNGTALTSTGSGAIYTYGNNAINNNGAFGTAPTPLALR